MAGKSLPDVSAKLVGDASGLVAEVKRGSTAVSTGTAKMEAEISRFQNSVRRKFSVGDIGKQFLQGLGIGSGFQLATTAVEKFAGYWREAAESAAIVAQQSERSTKALLSGLEKRRTTAQNITALEKEQRILQQQLAGAQAERAATEFNFANSTKDMGFAGMNIGKTISANFGANLVASQEAERIKAELQEIANTIADAKDSIKQEADAKSAAALKLLQKESAEMVDQLRKDVFGGREDQAIRALDLKDEILRKGTTPGDPITDSLTRQGLLLGGRNPQAEEGRKQTGLLEKINSGIAALNRQNSSASAGAGLF